MRQTYPDCIASEVRVLEAEIGQLLAEVTA